MEIKCLKGLTGTELTRVGLVSTIFYYTNVL